MHKKVFVGVGVALILLVGGFYALNAYIYHAKQGPAGVDQSQNSSYTNAAYQLSFAYPRGYFLKEKIDAGTKELPQLSLVLVEDTPQHRALLNGEVTDAMEGPPSITIDVYTNEPRPLSVDAWVSARMNWMKNFTTEPTQTMVGGVPGLVYLWDGLYPGKSIVVSKGPYIYVFSVTWLSPDDQMLKDFDTILSTVDLNAAVSQGQQALVGSWAWYRTMYQNGSIAQVPIGTFVLTFGADGSVTSTTDCNQLSGSYVVNGEVLSFKPFAMTKKYCEGSKDTVYAKDLSLATSYTIVGDELRIIMNRDAGVMVFTRAAVPL